jgi:hypothetical protein
MIEEIVEGLLGGKERLDAPPQANPFVKAEREGRAERQEEMLYGVEENTAGYRPFASGTRSRKSKLTWRRQASIMRATLG